ncbi:MAG: sigma-70 family RNA polymerase sigma factor [Actinomycetota bacterium]|nr:sigma-70 family RNA polymerase sigma factor [Actinomycetota bacterium]
MTAAAQLPHESKAVFVDHIVRKHLPLVGHLVRDLLSRLPTHVSRDDLLSAGMMALSVCAQSYDPGRGVPFAGFAAFRIRGALTDELRSMDWASRGVRSRARGVDVARYELAVKLGRSPKRAEVAQEMGLSIQDLDAVDSDVNRAAVLSLQALAPADGAELLSSAADGPEGVLLKREQLGYLRDGIDELPERLRFVVDEYFFAQRKMADIAAELGVTESRISQLRSEALVLLRAGMRSQDGEAMRSPVAELHRRHGGRDAYCAALAARSTLAGRLTATTLLGDVRTVDHTLRKIKPTRTVPAPQVELITADM